MPLTAAQLNAYLADQGAVTADTSKLQADQATEASDSGTIGAGLPPGGQATLSADGLSVNAFLPVAPATNPPTFTVVNIPLAQ